MIKIVLLTAVLGLTACKDGDEKKAGPCHGFRVPTSSTSSVSTSSCTFTLYPTTEQQEELFKKAGV